MSTILEAPQSRDELWLAKIAGEDVTPEEPQSRVEKWLAYIAENGGGTVDTEMSDVSTNAVENKVIKAYTDDRFNGANKAVAYASYSAMVTALNALGGDAYSVGQNVYIVSLGVPDLWVSAVNQTSVPYVYTDDDTIKDELEEYGYITVGYYRLSALETQKVDLTQFGHSTHTYTKADGTTVTEDVVVWQS